jgi:hypothetical protein
MRPIKLFIFINLLLFAPCTMLFAQQVEVGAHLGGAAYLGDLNQYDPVKISGVAGGAFVKLNFNPHWGLGLNYNYGKIKGNDAHSDDQQFRDRNLSFSTPLHEVSLLVDFNLFDLYAYNRKGRITPYIYLGVGGLIFNPKAKYKGDEYHLRDYTTEGQATPYKPYTIIIPYGVGVKYRLKNNWTVFSQIGYRTAFTDYIDDVSGLYAPSTAWPATGQSAAMSRILADRSGEVTGINRGIAGTQRGDFRKRDHYMFVGIGISYTFVSQKCFTF